MRQNWMPIWLASVSAWISLSPGVRAEMPAQETAVRRPVAMVLADNDRLLFVANQRSGTISCLDTATEAVIAEQCMGQRLSDLACLPDGRLLALDEECHELLLLSRDGARLSVVARTNVSPYPVTLGVSPDGRTCFVASLWSRRLSVVAIDDAAANGGTSLRLVRSLRLPFAPREQVLVNNGERLIVADSFGGRLAIVDPAMGDLLAVRELPGHNIRGLAWDARGGRLLAGHQIINSLAETTENDIHWGIVLINVLRWLSLDHVLDPQAEILTDSHLHPTGDSRSAGGDPSGLTLLADGTVLLTVAGTGRLAHGREQDYALQSVRVGARPTRVIATRDGRRAFVANAMDDSLSIIDLPMTSAPRTVPLGPRPAPTLIEQGERLFYDARLSLDAWFSCHSCHTDGHTCGALVDNMGDNSFGAAKQVLSLLGTRATGPWAWNGEVARLEDQVQNSLVSTMQGDLPDAETVAALSAYLRSLTLPPPLGSLESADDRQAAIRGEKVFTIRQCGACHNPHERYTSPSVYDVGLADRLGNRHFNPPSLHGVSQRETFFHDNQAQSLKQVFSLFGHGIDGELSEQDLLDLMAFLQTL